MKTAFVIHSLKIGGSEKFLVSLVNALYDEGHDPVVILLEKENPERAALRKGLEVVVIPRSFRYDLSVCWRIRAELLKRWVRQVFCVEPYSFFMARWANYFDRGMTFFLSLHNSLPIGTGKYLLDMACLRTFRSRDHAVFICQAQRDCYRSTYHFTPLLESVIYNGIDTDHFSPGTVLRELDAELLNWRQELGIQDQERVLLMVGRISPEKAHHHALLALKQLHEKTGLKPHLVVVGSGDSSLKDHLILRVKELQLDQYVHFVGSRSEVRNYLLKADGFLMTSVSETFSLAALEALSMGVPCSLTDVGGASEMMLPGCGVLSRPGDEGSIAASLEKLLQIPFDRKEVRKTVVQRFSLRQMIDQYRDLLGLKAVEYEHR